MIRRVLRPASPGDVALIASLEALLFPDNSLTEPGVARELCAGYALVWEHPAGAGYALVRPVDGAFDLLRLGVHPAAQGHGGGAALLDAVLADARAPVWLMVRKHNTRALGLYRRRGFVILGHYPAPGAWLMRWMPPAAPPREC